jgi:hypothetical protein
MSRYIGSPLSLHPTAGDFCALVPERHRHPDARAELANKWSTNEDLTIKLVLQQLTRGCPEATHIHRGLAVAVRQIIVERLIGQAFGSKKLK